MKNIIFKQMSECVESGDIVFSIEDGQWFPVEVGTIEYFLIGDKVGNVINAGVICAVAYEIS